MSMQMKGVNKALSAVDSITKRATKTFVKATPLLTIGANIAEVAQNSSDVPNALNNLQSRYTGADLIQGDWKPERMLKGAVPLIISAAVSKAVTMFL